MGWDWADMVRCDLKSGRRGKQRTYQAVEDGCEVPDGAHIEGVDDCCSRL